MMNKPLGIVIVGAAGRMGSILCRLVQASPELRLAGAVDRKDSLPELAGLDVPVAHDVAEILVKETGAVIIDFTAPEAALQTLAVAVGHGAPMVIGTTGFSAAQQEMLAQEAKKTPVLWSANMSVGINALYRMLPELARALGPAYDIEISEIHHGRKKDSPSGTALMLGEALAASRGWNLEESRISCRDGIIGERPTNQIGIQALRGGDVVGIHTVYFLGPGEIIEVKHQAESRENFAQGALRAAIWLSGRKPERLYSMQDVLDSSTVNNAGQTSLISGVCEARHPRCADRPAD